MWLKREVLKTIDNVMLVDGEINGPCRFQLVVNYSDKTQETEYNLGAAKILEKYSTYLQPSEKEFLEKDIKNSGSEQSHPDAFLKSIGYNASSEETESFLPSKEEENNISSTDHDLFGNLSMQIVGSVMSILGAAAVIVAFTVLNAATLGTAGLVVAGVGAGLFFAGAGLIAADGMKKQDLSPDNLILAV